MSDKEIENWYERYVNKDNKYPWKTLSLCAKQYWTISYTNKDHVYKIASEPDIEYHPSPHNSFLESMI